MRFAVIATGPSLTQAQVDAVRHLRVVAVSDAYLLAPWAEAMVSADAAWWRHKAPEFKGRRFSALGSLHTEKVQGFASGGNSGVLGIRVARFLGASEIVLLGFDGQGSHFFGDHKPPLKNTSEARYKVQHEQHRQEARECAWAKVRVWNCSPGTAIKWYPTARLEEIEGLAKPALHGR